MKAAVIIRRIGPYHVARLRALAEAAGDGVLAVEVVAADETYQWDWIGNIGLADRRTLFPTEAEVIAGTLWRRMAATLGAWRPEVVAVPGWADPAGLAALAWCHHSRVPTILMSDSTAHDAPRRPWREAIKRAVVRMADAGLVAGTPHLAYLNALGMSEARIATGYDVVDNAFFARGADLARAEAPRLRAQLNLPERYLLSVCRFVEKKNLLRLMEAQAASVARYPSTALPLVLIGGGPLEQTLRSRAATPDLAGHVIFRPFAQYETLPALYGLASGFVLASTVDQWGLVINEAMAAGLPVLVSACCGAAEDLIVNGVTGFVVDPLDVKALADGLARLSCLDDVTRASMGAAARTRIGAWGPERFARAFCRAAAAAVQHQQSRVSGSANPLLLRLLARATGPMGS
jgi:glycosyltransferase involved in cell wall biosynthesis